MTIPGGTLTSPPIGVGNARRTLQQPDEAMPMSSIG
jgi:hypothetical protein